MSASHNEIRTEPRPNCFLCGSAGKSLYQDLPSALFETPGRWSFSQCPRSECGLVWINPTPVEADLYRAYENYFTHGGDNAGKRSGTSWRAVLYAGYRAMNHPGWVIAGIAREKARRARMFLDDFKPGKLLDVGCGDGKFLSEMQALGWAVDGIDFDAKAVQSAKQKYGLSLRHGDLRSAGLPSANFDTVTMSHVIEHVTDPVGLLTEIKRVLSAGGQLVITTPNIESLGHRKFGSCWFGIDAPRHLNLFSAKSLSDVALRAGFEIVNVGSTAASADVFIGASYTMQEKQGHRMGHQPTPSVLRTFKAVWWQYREHFAVRRDPVCGEELMAQCGKK
ncbi:MAG: class I SAM-dependent methyltransferase [Pedosphaera sp.]|nr:class I SAM-dependent methyltransferase [Pedosphaera sp.]